MTNHDLDASIIKKYDQLKKRVHEIEQDNSDIHSKLVRAQKHVKRLRMERLILLEQLDQYYTSHKDQMETSGSDDSDEGSGIGSLMSDARSKHAHKRKRVRHGDKSGNTKNASSKSQETSAMPRKKKDPNAPKGPGNVFFLYCRMERGNFKDELPTENLGEVTRLLGQKWKAMTDDEKKKYYDIYDKEQEEYQKAMKSYKEAGGGDAGRIAVSEMNSNAAVKTENQDYEEDVDMMRGGGDDDDDDDDDGDDVDEDDENDDDEEDGGSIMDDASVATTNVSTIAEQPSTNTNNTSLSINTPTTSTTIATDADANAAETTSEPHQAINDRSPQVPGPSDPITNPPTQ